MEPRQKQFSLWYVLAAVLLMLGIQHFLFAPQAANLSYSDLHHLHRRAGRGGGPSTPRQRTRGAP